MRFIQKLHAEHTGSVKQRFHSRQVATSIVNYFKKTRFLTSIIMLGLLGISGALLMVNGCHSVIDIRGILIKM